ncbi:MAG TPA: sugar phosphate isomerase/epimerase family protein [Tepidisphaeraceae bacterium]|nr:sugar phosphate isomerase/epimerase family protein [Tepidisphaeraceae bacterium]
MSNPLNRRAFLRSTVAAAAGATLFHGGAVKAQVAAAPSTTGARPPLRKAVKIGMIKEGATFREKFELIKSLGFEGVEMDSPGNADREEAKEVAADTGIVIHGVVNSVHWQKRLSDPDPAVRAQGVEALRTSLKDAKFYGADTVLLVPGAVRDPKNENYEQVWERSQAEIRKVLPEAKELGVKIAIEVVWNLFITRPEQLVRYVDEFNDPIVGAYFDVSNMIRFGFPPQDWIRQLGKRMLKFDFKAYKHANFMNETNPWVKIGEGDEPWAHVHKALADVGYQGWATSEVPGGGKAELKDIAERMNKVLRLA